jgi:hypothetical protein
VSGSPNGALSFSSPLAGELIDHIGESLTT